MAVNAQVQTLPRRGVPLSPLGMVVLSVMLAAAVVMGVLVGRWTAPSTTAGQQAAITAPGWAAEANSAGFTGRLGFEAPLQVIGSDGWQADAEAAGFTGRLGFATGFTGRLGFSTPIQGPASGWEGAAKDAGFTGRLGTEG
ncbi:MAG: hypothetical protein M3Q23_07330 [Actinomycetota bacterium]|nr:hypothetical protein [Actinomycetota bacterium]